MGGGKQYGAMAAGWRPMTISPMDLRDFPYMPLYIGRLQRSKAWLMCKRDPALAFYLMNLWMRSWHEVPAGSLEDDDEVLADAAMCDLETWAELKPRVLRGWTRKDGRLYHITVTEIATESFGTKQKQRKRTEAARQALNSKRKPAEPEAPKTEPTEIVTPTVTEIAAEVTAEVTKSVDDATDTVTDTVTNSKRREGKGIEGKENPPIPPPKRGADWEHMEFWKLFPRKTEGPAACRKAWDKARKTAAFDAIMAGLSQYPFNPDYLPMATTWLNQKRWLTQANTPPPTATDGLFGRPKPDEWNQY